jgi:hypothetical protein
LLSQRPFTSVGSHDGENFTTFAELTETPSTPGWLSIDVNTTEAMRYWRVAKLGLVNSDRYTCIYAEVEFVGVLMADYADIAACPVTGVLRNPS